MKTAKDRLEEIKKEGYEIDFSTIFTNSFENYKKIALNAGLIFILIGIVAAAIIAIFIGLVIGFGDFNYDPENLKAENFSATGLIVYMFCVVLFAAIASPITAGIIKMAHCADKKEEFSIGTAFEYYKNPYFKEIFLATVIISFFNVTISMLFEMVEIGFVGTIIGFLIGFFTFLAIPFIIFGNLKAIEAIKASFAVISKQILLLFGLMIIGILFSVIGFIGCCIGLFFTIPFIYSMYYCIYNEIIGVAESDENDDMNY